MPDHKYKIVLVGAAEVGKTTLIQKYVRDTTPTAGYQATTGVDFLDKKIRNDADNETVTLQLFDMPGDKRYQSMNHHLSKGAAAFVIVVDLNNLALSCKTAKELIKKINADSENKDASKILVATKLDAIDSKEVSDKLKELVKFSKKHKLDFKRDTNVTSIFKNNTNVNDFFAHVVDVVQSVQPAPSIPDSAPASSVKKFPSGYNPASYVREVKPDSETELQDSNNETREPCWTSKCCFLPPKKVDQQAEELVPKATIVVVQKKKPGSCTIL